jgi:O-antigen ligase
MLFLPLYSVLRSSSFFQNRIANTTNAYSRVETYKVAIEVIKSNFLFGVGLGKYEDYFYQHHAPRKYASTQEELKKLPQSTPHNNLLAVMSEMGIIGAVPYLLSLFAVFVFSISMIRRGGEERTLGAAIFTLWLAYTLVGMTLTSGYYSDVNLILFFFSALFLRSKELKLGVKDEPVEKMEA